MNWAPRLASFIEQRLGIRLRDGKVGPSVARFVTARTETLGLPDPGVYVALVERAPDSDPEFQRLVSVVAIGHTRFMRDAPMVKAVARDLARHGHSRRPSVLCFGCSTGEEPWSLAIACREVGVEPQITAVDINVESLETAARGIYSPWSISRLSPQLRERYFEPVEGGVAIREELRRLVQFEQGNLISSALPIAPTGRWSVILCQHVFIYFSRDTVERVTKSFAEALTKHGRLVLGPCENLYGMDLPLLSEPFGDRVAYRRLPNTPHMAPTPVPPPSRRRPPRISTDSPLPAKPVRLPDAVEILERSREQYRTPLPPVRRPPPLVTWRTAVEVAASGEIERAQRLLADILEREPDLLEAHTAYGNLHLAQHEFDAALSAYAAAQSVDPLRAEVHFLEGVVHRKLGNTERALSALRRAQFLDASFWPAAYLLAGVFERLAEPSHQVRALQRTLAALERDNNDVTEWLRTTGASSLVPSRSVALAACRRQLDESSRPGR